MEPPPLRILLVLMPMILALSVNGDIEADFNELYEIYSRNKLYLAHGPDQSLEEGDYQENGSIAFDFDCPSSVSPEIPTSVHKLRPGDIKVVAAVGDSLSTAYAAGAPFFLPVMLNYWGVSASIGGNSDSKSIVTLPNLLRQYNKNLYGYSTGSGVVFTQPRLKGLNYAVVGARAHQLPKQVRKLIDEMRDDPGVDVANEWKLITMFIGGNDLCSGCEDERSNPEAFLGFVEEALQLLHDQVPRVLVNLVGSINAYMLPDLGGNLKCNLVHGVVCKCLKKGGGKEEIYERTKEYQRLVQATIESGKFDDKEDFTVVYQPFYHETHIPLREDGSPDTSFFAEDCFHLSRKGQSAQAVANWNGLFEPVGEKRLEWVPGESLECPSEEFPYICTNVNSKTGFLASPNGHRQQALSDGLHDGLNGFQTKSETVSSKSLIVVGVIGGLVALVVAVLVVTFTLKKQRSSRIKYQDL